MWQRFTERAKQAIFFAQQEAVRWKQAEVSAEHLVLALTRNTDNVARRILVKTRCAPGRLRVGLESEMEIGDATPSDRYVLSSSGKQVIDQGYLAARRLNDNYLGTEHLLLGACADAESRTARILAKCGIELDDLYQIVEEMHIQNAGPLGSAKQAVPLLKRLPAEQWKQLTEDGLPFAVLPDEIRDSLEQMVFKGLTPNGLFFSFEDSLVRVTEVSQADGIHYKLTVTGQTTISISSRDIAGEG